MANFKTRWQPFPLTSDLTFSNVALIVDIKNKQKMETKPLKFGGGQGLFRRHRGIFNTEEKEELNLWML